jgi:SNF2 family DNA or RNA helicase
LIDQWKLEIKNRCKHGLLSTIAFHGCNRSMEDRKLSKYNIVITTYQVLVREAAAETSMYKVSVYFILDYFIRIYLLCFKFCNKISISYLSDFVFYSYKQFYLHFLFLLLLIVVL